MNAEAREALEMIRRSTANESVPEYLENGCYARDAQLVIDACLAEFLPDDGEAISREWLLSAGFESVPSQMGPNYSDHYQLGKMNIWNFNGTGEWLLNDADWITMKTRYDVRQLCRFFGITLKEGEQAR